MVTPVAPATALCASRSSRERRQGAAVERSAWVKVWMPIWWPSATMRRARSGSAATWVPTVKKVACTPCRCSTARICGVQRGSGPSSKVSAIVPAAGRTVRGAPSWAAAITGPPVRTWSGTAVLPPLSGAAPSAAVPYMCCV
ncbi:hypothetical protein GCM10025734_04780 [Kitasatospora paranensis]